MRTNIILVALFILFLSFCMAATKPLFKKEECTVVAIEPFANDTSPYMEGVTIEKYEKGEITTLYVNKIIFKQ